MCFASPIPAHPRRSPCPEAYPLKIPMLFLLRCFFSACILVLMVFLYTANPDTVTLADVLRMAHEPGAHQVVGILTLVLFAVELPFGDAVAIVHRREPATGPLLLPTTPTKPHEQVQAGTTLQA